MLPHILPVLDLRRGQVLRGAAGDRDSYLPLQTPLASGAEPLTIACALRDAGAGSRIYVADLDGVIERRPQWEVLQRLADAGFSLIVDLGVRSIHDARPLLDLGDVTIVAALETSPGPEALAELAALIGPERLVFSLDLKGGVPLAPPNSAWRGMSPELIAAAARRSGVSTILVLDLRGVGSNGGPTTLPLCRRLHAADPRMAIWTGGGIRGWDDVQTAGACGVGALLVSSALHDGRLAMNCRPQ